MGIKLNLISTAIVWGQGILSVDQLSLQLNRDRGWQLPINTAFVEKGIIGTIHKDFMDSQKTNIIEK